MFDEPHFFGELAGLSCLLALVSVSSFKLPRAKIELQTSFSLFRNEELLIYSDELFVASQFLFFVAFLRPNLAQFHSSFGFQLLSNAFAS